MYNHLKFLKSPKNDDERRVQEKWVPYSVHGALLFSFWQFAGHVDYRPAFPTSKSLQWALEADRVDIETIIGFVI